VKFVADREHVNCKYRDHCDHNSKITIEVKRIEDDKE